LSQARPGVAVAFILSVNFASASDAGTNDRLHRERTIRIACRWDAPPSWIPKAFYLISDLPD